jgi:signal transduction histidine kinase
VLFTDITDRVVAEEKLREARDELEDRVHERTHELAKTNEVLSIEIEERKQLEKARVELVQRIVTAQEEERRRISRDLHDQLGQRLTALRLNLTALRSTVSKDRNGNTLVQRLVEIADTLDSEVSFLSSELRPTALDDLGLEEAVKAYCAEWSGHFNVPIDFHSNFGATTRVDSEVETHFYRIAQEALNNVAKHAKATQVAVMLQKTANGAVLVVEDNGVGFDPATARAAESGHGLGLIGMRERANLIKGQLEIESELGRGTTIYVKVPD